MRASWPVASIDSSLRRGWVRGWATTQKRFQSFYVTNCITKDFHFGQPLIRTGRRLLSEGFKGFIYLEKQTKYHFNSLLLEDQNSESWSDDEKKFVKNFDSVYFVCKLRCRPKAVHLCRPVTEKIARALHYVFMDPRIIAKTNYMIARIMNEQNFCFSFSRILMHFVKNCTNNSNMWYFCFISHKLFFAGARRFCLSTFSVLKFIFS